MIKMVRFPPIIVWGNYRCCTMKLSWATLLMFIPHFTFLPTHNPPNPTLALTCKQASCVYFSRTTTYLFTVNQMTKSQMTQTEQLSPDRWQSFASGLPPLPVACSGTSSPCPELGSSGPCMYPSEDSHQSKNTIRFKRTPYRQDLWGVSM